jgi:hypothetical protein
MRLLERESSLAMLDGCLTEAAGGRGSLVLVTGEAGFGKSALVRAFGAGAAVRAVDARVWFGGREALRPPRPLGPLRDIARVAGGHLAALVADEAARHRIFPAFLDLLSGHPPAVAVPPSVRDAVLARAARLSPAARSALDVAASSSRRHPPLEGATYGSFDAACHYTDGTFVPTAAEKDCPKTAPDGGAPFRFWHPKLTTLHVWLWYHNPDGLYHGTNPLVPAA